MKNIVINGVTYNGVPQIVAPLAGGGGNAVFYETSEATATANQILSGYKAFGANGEIVGQLTAPSISQDGTTKIVTIS